MRDVVDVDGGCVVMPLMSFIHKASLISLDVESRVYQSYLAYLTSLLLHQEFCQMSLLE